MSQTVKYGFKGRLYFNSGTYGTPVWGEIKNVRDVMVNFEFAEDDASTRLGGGWDQSEPTMGKISVTGKIRSDEGDTTGYAALETATLAGSIIDIMALDGDTATNGSRGVRFVAKNFKWPEAQELGKVLFREFDLKPCVDDNPPKKAVIASAAPVFTSLSRA